MEKVIVTFIRNIKNTAGGKSKIFLIRHNVCSIILQSWIKEES